MLGISWGLFLRAIVLMPEIEGLFGKRAEITELLLSFF